MSCHVSLIFNIIIAQKKKINKECKNHHPKCSLWAEQGDCMHYSTFMLDVCKRSCQICGSGMSFYDILTIVLLPKLERE